MFADRARETLLRDIDQSFLLGLAQAVPWEYDRLYEEVADGFHNDTYFCGEEFNRRRGSAVVRALFRLAKEHGIPAEFRRLECNGQSKLLVKTGRVILIQEPVSSLADRPCASNYKKDLADLHSFVRQLELDLGDQPHRIRDWSGCVLAVLLHGAAGTHFSRDQKRLGCLMLGVPDAAYENWILRLNLHDVAMLGRDHGSIIESRAKPDPDKPIQKDNVIVTPKRRKARKG